MPASPALYRTRAGVDTEMSSQLEITTEEKGGSESDYASSVANPESDEEQNSLNSPSKRKLSDEEITNAINSSLVASEPTIDSSSKIVNNIETELLSDSFSHEGSADNSCNETNEKNNFKVGAIRFDSHKTIPNVIEYKKVANL